MNKGQNTRGYARYIACDIHREYILVGGQNEDPAWVLTPRRVSLEKFPEWSVKNLGQGDIIILETTTNVWETYDVIVPLVSRVLVANAASVGEIVGARVKTDKEDITPALAGGARERLLKLLIGGIVPEVWVTPAPVRELRAFISYRNRLVKTGVMIRNRLQSLLHKHNLKMSEAGLLSWSLSEDVRQGLTYKQFAKYALMKLGVQTDITRFVRKNVPRRIASREEVLVRMAELGLDN